MMKPVVFATVLALAFVFFGRTIFEMVRAARRGSEDPRPRFDQLPARIASVLIYFFGQKKVAQEGPLHHTSKHHLLIFWGFLIITLASAEILINGIIPAFELEAILPGFVYFPLKWLIDFFNLVVLVIMGWSIFRRIVVQPHLIPWNLDAALILGAIACLMISHFLFHGMHAVAAGHPPTYAPISSFIYEIAQGMPTQKATFIADAAYWMHVLILLAFMNYLPYSKHIHLLGALPNIFLRNLSKRTLDMPKLDLEDENQWGVGRIDQFSWKSLVDTYACTECARCSNYCPAYATEKNLSPMQLIHDLRYELIDRDAAQTEIENLKKEQRPFLVDGKLVDNVDAADVTGRLMAAEERLEDMPPLVGGRIAEDTLWACTTCGACQEVCPVFIEHPLKIIQMRQNLVLEQEKVPSELGRMFRNIERQSNPWGIAAGERTAWMEGLEVATIEDNPDPEYILWVGCAGAFDKRIIKQTKAMVKLLNHADVSYAVLGHQEACTGDPARRAGNEMLFQMQAEQNIETLNGVGAKKVIASCPHCLHTLRHDYPQFGGDFEVIHHTQLLSHLLDEGRLSPAPSKVGSITFHDSCYLGRWNGEFDAPRNVIEHLNIDGGIVELKRNKQHGFCCGAGGAKMFMEEDTPRVNENRSAEVIDADVEAVAVACPFCSIMLTDGMKAHNKDEDIRVADVSELLAESIPDVPLSALTRKLNKDTSDDAAV